MTWAWKNILIWLILPHQSFSWKTICGKKHIWGQSWFAHQVFVPCFFCQLASPRTKQNPPSSSEKERETMRKTVFLFSRNTGWSLNVIDVFCLRYGTKVCFKSNLCDIELIILCQHQKTHGMYFYCLISLGFWCVGCWVGWSKWAATSKPPNSIFFFKSHGRTEWTWSFREKMSPKLSKTITVCI